MGVHPNPPTDLAPFRLLCRWFGVALLVVAALPLVGQDAPATDAPAAPAAEGGADDGEPSSETNGEDQAAGELTGPVTYGKIDGDIDLATSAFVTRLLDRARVDGARTVLIELNTFGGRVDAAVAIRDALLETDQRTVVFINQRAISAGALISLACDRIAIRPGGTIGAATPITVGPGQEMPQAVEEKYLSYFRQEMRATAEAKGRDGDLAEAMVDPDSEIPDVTEKGKLLTLTTQGALDLGLADLQATSLEELLAELGLEGEAMATVEPSWSEELVAFLTSAPIASLLALGMFVLGYLELQTPGFGVFGAGALVCLALLYFGHYLVNLAGHEELLLFAVGLLLLVVELFVIPGFGVAGILGVAAILSSLVMLMMAGDWTDLTFDNPFTVEAVRRVALVLLASLGSILLLLRLLPYTPLGSGVLLGHRLDTDEGYSSHRQGQDDLVGQTGVALSQLRPSGKARIGDRRMNVETEGDWIDKGVAVKVVKQVEGRIVVRQA